MRPVLVQLRDETGEGASFYRKEAGARVCLFREDPNRPLRGHMPEGSLLPLDKGASGRVLTQFEDALGNQQQLNQLLTSLPFVSLGEWAKELGSIAAPVFWAQRGLAGAIGLSGPITRFTPDAIAEMAPALLRAARTLSDALGGSRYWAGLPE